MTIFKEKKKKKVSNISIHPYRERKKVLRRSRRFVCISIAVNTHQRHQENALTLIVGVTLQTGATS